MKQEHLHRFAIIFIFVMILFSAESFNPVFAEPEAADEKAAELMIQGRYIQAEQVLKSSDLPAEKQKPVMAVIRYQDPAWYPEDYTLLKSEAPKSYALIKRIIESPVPDSADKNQRQWIIFVKIRFMKALTSLNPEEALTVLEKLLKDRNPAVRLGAVEAAGEIKSGKCAVLLYDFLRTEQIPTFNTADEIREASRMNDIAKSKALAVIVRNGGREILPQLLKEAEETGSPDRLTATIILTGLRLPQAAPFYRRLLQDTSDQLAVYGASALKDLGDNSGLKKISAIFKKGDISRKLWITEVLTGWESPDSVRILLDYLREECLTQPKLTEGPSIVALGKVPPLDRMTDAKQLLMAKSVQLLIKWRKTSVPVLLAELPKASGNLKYLIFEILGESEDPAAGAAFRENLKPGDSVSQYYSLWALGRIRDKSAIEQIRPFLKSPGPNLQGAAAWALARMGDDGGYTVCLNLLKNRSLSIKGTALATLYILRKKESADRVLEILKEDNPDPVLERAAITILGLLGFEPATEILLEKSKKTGINSYYAAEALYRLKGRVTPFALEKQFPWDLACYGDSLYSSMDYIRAGGLFVNRSAHELFPSEDFSVGYTRYGPVMGEFGQVTGAASQIILYRDPEGREVLEELTPQTPLLIRDFKRTYVSVCTVTGTEGWIHSDSLLIIRDSCEGTAGRLRWDFGYRWKTDLLELLFRDFLNSADPKVQYENLPALAAAFHGQFVLDTALSLSGHGSGEEKGKKIHNIINTGRKTVTVSLSSPPLTFVMQYGNTGRLEKIMLKQ